MHTAVTLLTFVRSQLAGERRVRLHWLGNMQHVCLILELLFVVIISVMQSLLGIYHAELVCVCGL